MSVKALDRPPCEPLRLFCWDVPANDELDEIPGPEVILHDPGQELPESIGFFDRVGQVRLYVQDPRDASRYFRTVGGLFDPTSPKPPEIRHDLP